LKKEPKTYNGKRTASSTNVSRKLDIFRQKTETRSMFETLYKYQLKVDWGPYMRSEILKLVQERVGNTLELIGIGNDFLNRAQMAQQLRERTDKWD
jgi:hypothetical protein